MNFNRREPDKGNFYYLYGLKVDLVEDVGAQWGIIREVGMFKFTGLGHSNFLHNPFGWFVEFGGERINAL